MARRKTVKRSRLYAWASTQKARIPRMWFLIGILAWILLTLGLILTNRPLWPFLDPNISLAWIALLLSIALVLGQISAYSRGIVYMLLDTKRREDYDGPPEKPKHTATPIAATGAWGVAMKGAYWLCLFVAVALVVPLTLGTFLKPTNADIDRLVQSNANMSQKVERLAASIEASHADIQAILSQNAEILKRLDALLSANATANKVTP